MKKTSLLVRGSALTLALFSALPAMAQDVAPADDAVDAADESVIVVTGSRIARPALESAVPVTSISSDELFATGNISVGDQLNELPALRSTFSQANSTRFIGTTGLSPSYSSQRRFCAQRSSASPGRVIRASACAASFSPLDFGRFAGLMDGAQTFGGTAAFARSGLI